MNGSAKPSVFSNFLSLLGFVLILFHFENCSSSRNDISFSENLSALSLESSHGVGYLGKPIEGDYRRTYTNYSCQGSADSVGIQGKVIVDASAVNVETDNCIDSDLSYQFTDSRLAFANYNPDYLSIGASIFERVRGDNINDSTVTESWCRSVGGLSALDVVVKVNSTLATAHVYMGRRSAISQEWAATTLPTLNVSRSVDSTVGKTTYSGAAFNLVVATGSFPTSAAVGKIVADINGERFDQEILCRIANAAPVAQLQDNIIESQATAISSQLENSWINTVGLVSYWSFDEPNAIQNSSILDQVGANPLTLITNDGANVKSVAGKVGGAISLDGVDDHLRSSVNGFPLANADQTISVWYRYVQNSFNGGHLIGIHDNTAFPMRWSLAPFQSSINVDRYGSIATLQSSGTNSNDNGWHHVAYVQMGNNRLLYFDGVLNVTTIISPQSNLPGQFFVGIDTNVSRTIPASVDEISVWNRPLSASEISVIYSRQVQ